MVNKVAIIGGGPAGLVAAISAGRLGANVTVFEASDRIGKKILATGNGRCNMSNSGLNPEAYKHPDFVRPVFDRFGYDDTLKFFRSMGLLTVVDGEGRVYPRTKQASSVLNCLRAELGRMPIRIITDKKVSEITPSGDKYIVDGEAFDRVIIATGGGSAVASALGHTVIKGVPTLTAVVTDKKNLVGLSGKRVDAIVTLIGDGTELAERGEVLFRDNGLSGIAVFNHTARMAWGKGPWKIALDVVPELSEAELCAEIEGRNVVSRGTEALEGLVDRFLAQLAIKAVGTDGKKLAGFFKAVPYAVQGVRAEGAQVTSGGVDVSELTSSLKSKRCKGLYVVGEAVDVDGLCGGYNLQWAWSSGYIAGTEAARG